MSGYKSKSEFIVAVAEAADIPRTKAEKAINSLFDQIAVALKQGQEVRIASFGVFRPTIRQSRKVKLAGVESSTRACTTVHFKPYDALKQYQA